MNDTKLDVLIRWSAFRMNTPRIDERKPIWATDIHPVKLKEIRDQQGRLDCQRVVVMLFTLIDDLVTLWKLQQSGTTNIGHKHRRGRHCQNGD
jgi:hypothetical protein